VEAYQRGLAGEVDEFREGVGYREEEGEVPDDLRLSHTATLTTWSGRIVDEPGHAGQSALMGDWGITCSGTSASSETTESTALRHSRMSLIIDVA
jgi:hypothetical protein